MKRIEFAIAALLFGALGACDDASEADPSTDIGEAVSETHEAEDIDGLRFELANDKLCSTCTSNADCGANGYCFRGNDGTRFCGEDCRTTACPVGFVCLRGGSTFAQCIPQSGRCPRPADAGTPSDAGARDAGPADAGAADAAADAGPADAGLADAAPADAGAADAGASDVPATAHCAPVANWDPNWTAYENEVLRLSNLRRQSGATCGGTPYAPTVALSMDPALRCAARLHSKDMFEKNYFSHTSPSGVTFSQRITAAGYRWRTAGENIAWGYRTPADVVTGWMNSEGHCRNLMNPSFRHLGVGFYGNNFEWTQDFAAP